jgi:peroxiredoxin family protein
MPEHPAAGADTTVEFARAQGKTTLVIVMSKGGADMAYPSLILATTARALGMESHIYFTFWGMQLLTPEGRRKSMDVFPPEMQKVLATKFPTIEQFMQQAKQAGVHIHACSPTMELFGLTKQNLVSEVEDVIGASTYLELASRPDVLALFI